MHILKPKAVAQRSIAQSAKATPRANSEKGYKNYLGCQSNQIWKNRMIEANKDEIQEMFKSSSQQNFAKASRNGSRLGRPKAQVQTRISANIDAFNTVVNC